MILFSRVSTFYLCSYIKKKRVRIFIKINKNKNKKLYKIKLHKVFFIFFFGHFSILLDFIVLSKLCIYFSVQDVKL